MIDWNKRIEKAQTCSTDQLKRLAGQWLGKGWQKCNSWNSIEARNLAVICKERLSLNN
jgi:hypothetical protein